MTAATLPTPSAPPPSVPPQPISSDVLRDSYAQPGETTIDQVRMRIARALAAAEPTPVRAAWQQRFFEVQQAGFIPAGRIAANAGVAMQPMMINCFVQPLADSAWWPEGAAPSAFAALGEAAETMRLGGGVGLDFSPLRPRGARVRRGDGSAAGVVAFLQLFEAAATVFDGEGARRAALMGVLRCDHPDLPAFVAAKASGGLAHFNLSVAVSDEFMAALERGGKVELVHAAEPGGQGGPGGPSHRQRADGQWVHGERGAAELWRQILRAAHARGEPGVLFIDRINRDNNLGGSETLAATNPCGEEPLPPYGGCCLGSFDLTRFVLRPFEPDAALDLAALAAAVPTAVRMLDNVIDLSAWPLPQQRAQALAKRRIGLGITGLGDALAMLGQHYGSNAARASAAAAAQCLRDAAYAASVQLARERGAFPAFDASSLLQAGRFASRLPAALREAIATHGLRNSHLLAIAPAGSVSLAFADNVSSGIEPAYAWRYLRDRRRRDGTGVVAYEVQDHAWRLYMRLRGEGIPLPPAFVTALELAPEQHLEMAAAVAPFIDGAISKTVNAPERCPYSDFETTYRRAWALGLKGITSFRANRVLGGVLHAPGAGC